MIKPARCTIEFNCQSDAGRNPGSQAKEGTKPKPIPGSEDNRIRDRASQQPQRPVLSTQQVVRKIEAPQHIKTRARNADSRDCVVVHARIVELTVGDDASLMGELESRGTPTLP